MRALLQSLESQLRRQKQPMHMSMQHIAISTESSAIHSVSDKEMRV